MDRSKLRHDGAPMALFALIVGAKLYALGIFLNENPLIWHQIRNLAEIRAYAPGAFYHLISQITYLLYFVTAVAFDALVFYSFLVRSEAKSRPQGPWENLFPLATVFLPMIGFTLLSFPQVRHQLPGFSVETLARLHSITPLYPFYLSVLGFALGFIGVSFSIWSLSHLKRSFGLRAAVRTLVTTGPYARIRHPLYLGEIIHVLGIAILSATPVGFWLLIPSVALQVARAKIEERKFLRTLPEYAAYKANTGFLWPRLRRPGPQAAPG